MSGENGGWIPQHSKDGKTVHVARPGSEAHVKYVSNSRRTKQKQNDEKVTKDDEKEDDSKNMMPCMEFSDIIFITTREILVVTDLFHKE